MKGPEMFAGPLVTKFQSAVVADPRQTLLHDVAGFAQAAAMATTSWREQACDHQTHNEFDDMRESITAVSLQDSGLFVAFAPRIRQHRHLLEHRLDQLVVSLVGWADAHEQGRSMGVADHMPLTAWLGAVRRVRAGVRPPFKARTEALSMITRRVSKLRSCANSRKSLRWSVSHTPVTLHSWNRRQQVL